MDTYKEFCLRFWESTRNLDLYSMDGTQLDRLIVDALSKTNGGGELIKASMNELSVLISAFNHNNRKIQSSSLPSDLDEAAKKYYFSPACSWEDNEERFINAFKAGAEWMAGQGWKEVSATDYPKPDKNKIFCVYTKEHYLLARVINHPNDDELFQWKCTEFPHTRYDMCEGDSYFEILKKQ